MYLIYLNKPFLIKKKSPTKFDDQFRRQFFFVRRWPYK